MTVPPAGGVAECVAEQVVEDLAQPVRICPHLGRYGTGLVVQHDALVAEGGRGGADRLGDDRVDVHRLGVHLELALLGAGDAVDVVDQPAQPGGLLPHGLPGLAGGGDDLVLDAFQEAVHRGDGGTQLVREVGRASCRERV